MFGLRALHCLKIATWLALFTLAIEISEARLTNALETSGEQIALPETSFLDSSKWHELRNIEAQLLAQRQQPRAALVIGNAAYEEDPLRNPVNDATDVARSLEKLGFEVTLLTDLDWREMDVAIEDFRRQLRQGGVGVFYYAGHGVQVEGKNYLIPTDAQLERERDVMRDAISLNDVIDSMEETKTEVNVLIIDACRDNPFYRRWRSSRRGSSPQRGLAEIPALPQGTVISFATEPGGFAEDGEGQNSPFTASLLKHISSEGQDVVDVFRKVRANVMEATNEDQIPWYQETLVGSFSFNPDASVAISSTPSQPRANPSTSSVAISSTPSQPRANPSTSAEPPIPTIGQNLPDPKQLTGQIILSRSNNLTQVCLKVDNYSNGLPGEYRPVFTAWTPGSDTDIPMTFSSDNSCPGGYVLSRNMPSPSLGGTLSIHDNVGLVDYVLVGSFTPEKGGGCADVGMVLDSVINWQSNGEREKAANSSIFIRGNYGWVCHP